MKIYTRTGDDGTTGLYGGGRTSKASGRIDAIGAVDEANSHLGLAAVACNSPELADILATLKPRLFDLGADLSTPIDAHAPKEVRIGQSHIDEVEAAIDRLSGDLPPLKTFILPGGCETAARLHLARTVTRRAERAIVDLAEHEPVNEAAVAYVNRIGDLLFVMARYANKAAGVDDIAWTAEG